MIYNKSMINEKYGTSYPFYPITSTDPVVLCLWSHISSCTVFLPVGMLPPVYISSVSVDRVANQCTISFKDKRNNVLGAAPLNAEQLSQQADVQLPIWSFQGILMGYIEITESGTFVQELMTVLSGALDYHISSGALRILSYCTHAVQVPKPAVVQIGTDIPEYTYLGRGLLNSKTTPGPTDSLSISVYAETPIGDYTNVPVQSINGVSQGNLVWVTPKNQDQDITVKTYDYILIQGYVEQ